MALGLLSGKHAVEELEDGAQPNGIRPYMFKRLIGKGHAEFSGGKQQDASEYLHHLIDKIEEYEKGKDDGMPATADL